MSGDETHFTLQQVVGAAERLRARRAGGPVGVDWLALVEEAHARLNERPFVARPIPAFVEESGGKERVLASPGPVERLVEETLLPRLHRALDPKLLPCTHGYRKGRSAYTAAAEASRALAAGRTAVALLDVADCYGSIDRAALGRLLEEALPPGEARIVHALVAAPLLLRDDVTLTPRGIPLGRAVSPLLANVFLVPVDHAAGRLDVSYVRFADDLFLAAATAAERDAAEGVVVEALRGLGLELSAAKARRFEFTGQPFAYLGLLVDGRTVYERVGGRRLSAMEARAAAVSEPRPEAPALPVEDLAEQPNRRSQTLYVTEPGLYLKVDRGQVVVKRRQETVRELPLHRVDRVLVLAGVSMSSGFLSACVASQVPVLFFVGRGRAFGSLVAGGLPNPLRLRAQYDLLGRPERRLELARAVVDAKLEAMQRRLRFQPEARDARERVAEVRDRLASAPDTPTLRGHEGAATRAWYEGWALRLKPEGFRFKGRTKRPPRDPLNSLLSFAYSLVFGEMQTALLAEGLDPHPGLFHDLRANHPALASDLVEPYRVLLADSFVLALVNGGRISPDGFETHASGAVYMSAGSRRVVLPAYEAFMDRRLGGGRGDTPRRLVQGAARSMLRVVLGECDTLALPLRDAAEVLEEEVPA